MKTNFDNALMKVLNIEGGYSIDPYDPGNWTGGRVGKGILKGTKYGISAASYPSLDIRNLTLEAATAIYRRDFWDALELDEIAVLVSTQVADMLFNMAVNCGPGNAGKFAQRAINTLVIQDRLGIPVQRKSKWQQEILRLISNKALKVDGIIGPITKSALKRIPYPVAVAAAIFGEAYKHYAAGKLMYRAGWFNRLGFSYLT